MGRWFGKIGYVTTIEMTPGVWQEQIIEREYYGDILRVQRSLGSNANVQETINDDLLISNEISIIADPFAYEHFAHIRYIWLWDARWKIKSVEVRYPKLILQIGGIYHGTEIGTSKEVGGNSGE